MKCDWFAGHASQDIKRCHEKLIFFKSLKLIYITVPSKFDILLQFLVQLYLFQHYIENHWDIQDHGGEVWQCSPCPCGEDRSRLSQLFCHCFMWGHWARQKCFCRYQGWSSRIHLISFEMIWLFCLAIIVECRMYVPCAIRSHVLELQCKLKIGFEWIWDTYSCSILSVPELCGVQYMQASILLNPVKIPCQSHSKPFL